MEIQRLFYSRLRGRRYSQCNWLRAVCPVWDAGKNWPENNQKTIVSLKEINNRLIFRFNFNTNLVCLHRNVWMGNGTISSLIEWSVPFFFFDLLLTLLLLLVDGSMVVWTVLPTKRERKLLGDGEMQIVSRPTAVFTSTSSLTWLDCTDNKFIDRPKRTASTPAAAQIGRYPWVMHPNKSPTRVHDDQWNALEKPNRHRPRNNNNRLFFSP